MLLSIIIIYCNTVQSHAISYLSRTYSFIQLKLKVNRIGFGFGPTRGGESEEQSDKEA